MANEIKKLTSEPAIFLLIFLSFLLTSLLTNEALASKITSVYAWMLIGDFVLWSASKEGFGSGIQGHSGNTAQALLYAGISLAVLFGLYQGVIYVFRQSLLPASQAQLTQTVFQTVFQSMTKFGSQDVDFSQLVSFNYYLFGFLIPIMETRVIGRIYGALAYITNINISDFRNFKNYALIGLVSLLFMYFHLKIRGINNNIDLAITFLFAIVQLFLVGKFRELESANYMHVGWNSLSLALGK